MPSLKLRGKIISAAALVFIVAMGASLFYVVSSTQQQAMDHADDLLTRLAETQGEAIKVVLEEHIASATSLAQSVSSLMADTNVSPETYKSIFENQLANLPNALGVWFLTVPGSLAAQDPDLADMVTKEGYFGFDLRRDAQGATSSRQFDSSATGALDTWFTPMLGNDGRGLLGPYIDGDMLNTSTYDMVRDASGKAVGLVSLDFSGNVFSSLIETSKPMGTGSIGVINQDGNWVVNADASLIGKPANDPISTDAIAGSATRPYHVATMVDGAPWRMSALTIAMPKFDVAWTVMVSVPEATLLADAVAERNVLLFGGVFVLISGFAVFWFLGTSITKPIGQLTRTMDALAGGQLDTPVQGAGRTDEIGAMARAVEVFRENGLKMNQMSDEERIAAIRRREERSDMMVALQAAFGEVVDAAVAGDFSKRVHAEFPDAELNALASSVNSLVETVDRGIVETGQVLSALADTDLTQRMQGKYSGAFAKLQSDINAVGDKLTGVVTQLRSTSRALKTATSEILSGANDLSERTTRQAATIEQTSAAMEQLATTVVDNARMAEDASIKAQGVSTSAAQTGAVMDEANDAMGRITTSSAKISNIIGMIDDIAFQTNLLALNASVEAARAGDAGKGFAVVAVEVRRLAQSAAQASSEVKVLIEQSANEVKGGSKLVSDASGRLSAMLEAIGRNNTLMHGIATASREQASAIDEVSTAVRLMDEMTQHNAALVEQTNAAIEQTEAQASELDRVVAIFTIDAAERLPIAAVRSTEGQRSVDAKRTTNSKTRAAASTYLSRGNAAIAEDWNEF